MKSRIIAIPMLAVAWLGMPLPVLAQDSQPRTAVDRPRDGAQPASTQRGGGDRGTRPRSAPGDTGPRASGPRDNGPRANGPRENGPRDNSPSDNGRRGPSIVTPRGYTEDYRADQRPNGRPSGRPNGRPNGPNDRPNDWPNVRPNVRVYAPVYYDRWAYRNYRFSPLRFVPWNLIYGSVGLGNYGYYSFGFGNGPSYYGSSYYGPSSYGGGVYPQYGYGNTTFETGNVRLQIRPRDAQVFVDGYYAGCVDDFDGVFQSLRLEQGPHKIEVRMPGYQTFEIDVHVQPGRTLTIREDLRP
jgi:hypothetical protein